MASEADKDILNEQNPHWEKTYSKTPEMFGEEPSEPAKKAAELFRKVGAVTVLELGAGQGRDIHSRDITARYRYAKIRSRSQLLVFRSRLEQYL